MKRGQVTVFIILGILLLAGVGFYLYLSGREAEVPLEAGVMKPTTDPRVFQEFVEACLAETVTQGVYTIAAQGGYSAPKGDWSLGDSGDGLPIHYYVPEGVVPFVLNRNDSAVRPLADVELVLARYVAANFDECLDFSDLEARGYEVKKPTVDFEAINWDFARAKVEFAQETVRIDAELRPEGDIFVRARYPIAVSGLDASFTIPETAVVVPLRLALLHKIAVRLADQIGKAARQGSAYKVDEHCQEYAPADMQVNVYAFKSGAVREALITVVDASPRRLGLAPLRFNIAVRNADAEGVCLG
ncbi:hypothetical protein C4580_00630 [Candidatus Woesearchaeota archaeon]|nr:MAG: hypothetical protein C4580_00630 [Candidatus Woesearchaeota archaeon]